MGNTKSAASVLALVLTWVLPTFANASDVETCLSAADRGQDLRAGGSLIEARESFALCARDHCPTVVRGHCARWFRDTEEDLPTVVLVAKDAEHRDLVSVRVLLDGALLAEHLDGQAVAIDPGPHRLRFESEGRAPAELELVTRVGEKNRLVAVHLGGMAPAKVETLARRATADEGLKPPVLGYVLGGVGIGALGAFGFFGVSALDQASDLGECRPYCSEADIDGLKRTLLLADVSLGVGIVAVALAAWTLITARPSSTGRSRVLGPSDHAAR